MTKVYVTIGFPTVGFKLTEKTVCFIESGETPVQVAKQLRKQVADEASTPKCYIPPSALYYEIYENVTDKVPFFVSVNSPLA